MRSDNRQIFAFSGLLHSETDKHTNFDLTNHALVLAGKDRNLRVCYVPTAVGDSPVAVEATTSTLPPSGHEAVTIPPAANAWWVEADGVGGYAERAVVPRAL